MVHQHERVPIRTCVGCRRTAAKKDLLRAVAKGDRLALDPNRRMPGRGTYVHPRAACIEAAGRGSLARSLRRRISPGAANEFREAALMAAGPGRTRSGIGSNDRATKEGQS